ncbi:MAG TPA: energy-coupling factor ABC transporter ATP-binding protein, partial [Firmicutes bacterium]|nr:energy-coupling factor ABC transporter ATP-binding protein [Bacillota bacterium]
VVITGPTGAGKTTLCETLNGVIPNFIKGELSGEIIVDGLNAKSTPVYKMASKVGMVFQDPDTQLFGMTVEEDIAFGPANLGLTYEQCMERVAT